MTVKNLGTNHITATEIRHIKALIESGHTQAKINRAHWVVISGNGEGEYELRKTVNDRGWGWIGSELRQSTYNYKVKINN